MLIKSFQITNVNFPLTITDAMSEVVASLQLRKAAENKAKPQRSKPLKKPRLKKSASVLQARALRLSAKPLPKVCAARRDHAEDHQPNSAEIMAILNLTQYLDTLKTVGGSTNSK